MSRLTPKSGRSISGERMFELRNVDVAYGDFQVLWDVDLTVNEGEIVCVLGPNGAGKSTVLNAVVGLAPRRAGQVFFENLDISAVPTHEMASRGIALVLERHRLFPSLTVRQNLMLGGYNEQARQRRAETLEWVESLFPFLAERQATPARSLSGGQQQMVAIARGLMSRPRLLMLDEPLLGLSPAMTEEILAIIKRINQDGVAILFNEQNVQLALDLSHRGYLLESGRVVLSGLAQDMLKNDMIAAVYFGVS
jgi:branched-chain amino acid transport system ATP-binding protein